MKAPVFLKRFVAWGTGLRDKARYDIFFRTTALIVATQLASALLMLVVFWWALQYTQGHLIDVIADYIVDLVRRYPALPEEDFEMVANRVKTESVILVFIGMAALSAAFGFILSRLTLRPAREALRYQKRFIGNIAHELRTPLSVIKTSTEVSLLDDTLPDNTRRALHDTVLELDRISEIINNLLSFNTLMRPERMDFSHVDLGLVIDRVVKNYSTLAHKRGLVLTVQKGERVVRGNAAALEQVVTNLVKNAIDYTPRGKSGMVGILVDANSRGGIELSVSDTGIGIPEEELFHIFDPFYRGDTSRVRGMGGTSGLGLAIVNEIVRIHQGKILVRSIVNEGTTVTVIFPAAKVRGAEVDSHAGVLRRERGEVVRTSADARSDASEISHDFSKGL